MKKTTVRVSCLERNLWGPPHVTAVEVDGYELEPGWVVHRAPRGQDWGVTHAESGLALIQHAPMREFAAALFRKLKADGTVAQALKHLKEGA